MALSFAEGIVSAKSVLITTKPTSRSDISWILRNKACGNFGRLSGI